MSTLKRKLLLKTNVCEPVMKRLRQPGGGGGGGGGDRGSDRGGDRGGDRGSDRGGGSDGGGDRGSDRGGDRGSDRGGDRGSDRGGDRGSDRGGDRGSDRGRDRGSDRGGDRGSDRGGGGDRGSDRGGDRGSDRGGGGDRGGDRGSDRGGDRGGDRGSDRGGDRGSDRGGGGDRGSDRGGDRGSDRGGGGDRGGDRGRGMDEEDPTCSQYFPSKAETGPRLRSAFFIQPCVDLAKALLGKVLVRRHSDGTELRGRVVETEAYLGGEDKASHSAGGKRTERNAAMFMKPGTIYVYPIYGIYLCMNISSQGEASCSFNFKPTKGEGAAVLLRSLEPLQGQDVMRMLRASKRKEGAKAVKDRELCNGPSKLCQALDIRRSFDHKDLASVADVWLEMDTEWEMSRARDLVSAPRIGIESHGEWAFKPLRFYLRGHPCVSVVDRVAESKQ